MENVEEMIKRRDYCARILTNDDDHFLSILDEFYDLTEKINKHFAESEDK